MSRRRKKEIRHRAGDGIHQLPNGQVINMATVTKETLKLFAQRFPGEFIVDFPVEDPDPDAKQKESEESSPEK